MREKEEQEKREEQARREQEKAEWRRRQEAEGWRLKVEAQVFIGIREDRIKAKVEACIAKDLEEVRDEFRRGAEAREIQRWRNLGDLTELTEDEVCRLIRETGEEEAAEAEKEMVRWVGVLAASNIVPCRRLADSGF
eukprot:2821501-Alexandrium_andersonii.AAC.2